VYGYTSYAAIRSLSRKEQKRNFERRNNSGTRDANIDDMCIYVLYHKYCLPASSVSTLTYLTVPEAGIPSAALSGEDSCQNYIERVVTRPIVRRPCLDEVSVKSLRYGGSVGIRF
jgi:hypothetical protein